MVKKLGLIISRWWHRSWKRKIFDIVVYAFALAGAAIIGAWAFFQLGFTKNKGAVDENYRYLMSVQDIKQLNGQQFTPEQLSEKWSEQYLRLAVFGRYYPTNARLILEAAQCSNNPMLVERMIAASEVYAPSDEEYQLKVQNLMNQLRQIDQSSAPNLIPWMNTVEWDALKKAIVLDSAAINEAGRLCNVEPRLIAGCLIGEQIRLFNSKREMFKKYLGPVKVLSVQSQFSYGVNGIKEHTAKQIEENLVNDTSPYYMGKHYEHLLDFETEDHVTERYNRLVDYRNHLYSYLYTACILRQTMLQWKRAGYDISDRPDILFTLFNVGFPQSVPKPNPVCGGSHVTVDGRVYTFGAIGFDFYYSGELADAFPYWDNRFPEPEQRSLTNDEVADIQENVSECKRPERGSEYRKDTATASVYFSPTSDGGLGEASADDDY